ncbi:MAG: IS21 family transposase [Bacteroidales bacterium]|nr:IS21 family transposase [Bacteroidales bacterium]
METEKTDNKYQQMGKNAIAVDDLRKIIRFHIGGMSNRKIAKAVGRNKSTVDKYLGLAKADPMGLAALSKLDDFSLEKRLLGGVTAYTDSRKEVLNDRMDYYVGELKRRNVTARLLWEEYRRDFPDGYSLSQFKYHLQHHREASEEEFSYPLSELYPGLSCLQIDFAGDTSSYVDPSTGEEVKCQVFNGTMALSGYGFICNSPSQKMEDFLRCIEKAFRFLGGVPEIVVCDNLKSAVKKADKYDPDINQTMKDFAEHYGFILVPAPPRSPKAKAKVERQVQTSYTRIYAPLRDTVFFGIDEMDEAMLELMCRNNQRRVERMPYTREERFLSHEKGRLRPMNPQPFLIITRSAYVVQENSHIYIGLDQAYYSVPFKYIGAKVPVLLTLDWVKVVDPVTREQVAFHKRRTTPGYSTVNEHLPSYYAEFASRSKERYIERAKKVSEPFGLLMEGLFSQNTKVPQEVYYKSAEGLLRLQKRTDADVFTRVCVRALQVKNTTYRYVKDLLESGYGKEEDLREEVQFPGSHDNIRGEEYFAMTLWDIENGVTEKEDTPDGGDQTDGAGDETREA